MTTSRSGVLNPIERGQLGLETVIDAYIKKFDNHGSLSFAAAAENRRQAIASMALTPAIPEPFGTYHSRIPVAAHWAESQAEMEARYKRIYDLQQTVGYYAGQTLLRFKKGSPSTLTQADPTDIETSVTVLRISPGAELNHGIREASSVKQAVDYDETERFAQYAVSIPVERKQQTITKCGGKIEVIDKLSASDFVIARLGIVSLHPSINIYRATVQEHATTLLFGDVAARQVLTGLAASNRDGAYDLATVPDSDEQLFSPNKPIPDLSFLATNYKPHPQPNGLLLGDIDFDAILAQNATVMQQHTH